MSNYTKATDFAAKDALLSGDPAKVIKGTEIDTEYNAIAVAVSTKVDSVSPTFTGTPAAPTATPGTNTTQIATTAFVTAADTAAVTAERSATVTLTNKTINLANNTLVATSAQVAAAVTDETGTGALVFATSPALAGTPTSPTASPGTNTTQVATTAFVTAADTAAIAAERTATATLTNKTLTSPTITGANATITSGTITGITDLAVADGGTGVSALTAENVLLGDGTNPVKFVAPGTSGNVLTSNGTTWASAAIPAQGIGVGQTWQDVSGSRSLGTTYTNSTGKPILVLVRTGSNSLSATIGGVNLGVIAANQSGGSGGQNVAVIVPDTVTYVFTSSGSLQNWSELR